MTNTALTTTEQAVALAPWTIWWIGVGVVVLVLQLALRWQVHREGRGAGWAWALAVAAGLQLFAGFSALLAMLMASVRGWTASPWWFIGAWLAFCAGTTALFLGMIRRSHPSGE